ncbi:MAG: DUF2309 domain-containing protein [Planctomycetaceae bacterium]
MTHSITLPQAASPSSHRPLQAEEIHQTIPRLGALLPFQGPITSFVFLNPLQGLEGLPFDEAVRRGAEIFGCAPYLSETRYLQKQSQGRITAEELSAVLTRELGPRANDPVGPIGTRQDFRLELLRRQMHLGPPEELAWWIAETNALRRLQADVPAETRHEFLRRSREWILDGGVRWTDWPHAELGQPADQWTDERWEQASLVCLWHAALTGVRQIPPVRPQPDRARRLRDQLLRLSGVDCDQPVHELLIRLCAAVTDQGLAGWQLPDREEGLWKAFLSLYSEPGWLTTHWLTPALDQLKRLRAEQVSPVDSLIESLSDLGISRESMETYLRDSLVPLRGWAGLLWQMETRSDRVATPVPQGALLEFLAVRLLLDRIAARKVAAERLNYHGPLAGLWRMSPPRGDDRDSQQVEVRALQVFQVAQWRGWTAGDLLGMSSQGWEELVHELETFTPLERCRIQHLAFETRYREKALSAIAGRATLPSHQVSQPRFQAVFCIDTREESFRRHLEEVCPEVETFGAAGFFGVPIYYRGIADAHYSTLCPIVVRPQHWIVEDVIYTQEASNRRRSRTRKALGQATHSVQEGSRGLATGALLTAGLGVLASVPLVASVLFPRLTSRIQDQAARLFAPPRGTRLRLERSTEKPGPEGDAIGFSLAEMVNMSERTLRDIGLIRNFAPLVFFVGHGSFCLNNPHKSAYDCGACSGGAGGPNARALAAMLNDMRVRLALAERGIEIPHATTFIGALHNTGEDSITYYELETLSISQQRNFEFARQQFEETCERNARERCRRFYSAPLDLTPAAALRHVEARTVDLAQTRPEFGNATNEMCFVVRRSRIRGLYLDRRCFQVSYDATTDDLEATILGRILGAVVPVCEGINLLYYFSYIDPQGWGAGTKLPHNVTSLLGVMDGAASDLRGGLPWQGVEIHEPMRLLFVIESRPEALHQIMARNATVRQIIGTGWVQVALLSPETPDLLLFQEGDFRPWQSRNGPPPFTDTSWDWYHGRRDNLDFALLASQLEAPHA